METNNEQKQELVVSQKQEAVQKHTNTRFDNSFDMQALLTTAGTLKLTDKQLEILREDPDENAITIRPDGLVFASWIWYQKKLDEAFGASWSLVPNGMPQYSQSTRLILWGFTLIVDGKFVDFAIGQQEYIPNNPTMTYGDAIEGAKSNALMRCCKRLGLGLKLWDKKFVEEWKSKYAECVWDASKGRKIWRLKEKQENKIESVNGVTISQVTRKRNGNDVSFVVKIDSGISYVASDESIARRLHEISKTKEKINITICDGAIVSFTSSEDNNGK